MNCANCARHVTDALQATPGVAQANVSLQEGRAKVRWRDGAEARVAELVKAVHAAGYEAAAVETNGAAPREHHHEHGAARDGWRVNVILGAACTLPLMAGDWLFGLGMTRWFQWAGLALAAPVQIICGARFYRGAWRQLRTGGSNMDTLVALGSTAAFAYSLWQLLSGQTGHSYFMEAAAIITLISVGHWMEARASALAEKSLRALFQLAPPTARRLNPDGSEIETPVAQLRAGDVVVLRPGERAPADGKVKEGRGSVDESMLTGESMPVDKQEGAELYAGTMNLDGRILMTVTATGETTAVARIIAAVQRAQNSRADIQRLADRISNVFVPAVVGIGLLTAVCWFFAGTGPHVRNAVINAVAVLIVACPCAMGLATPIAIMAGTNAGARRGILIRDGAALEKTGRLTAIIFDKTGTLTVGKPEATSVETIIDSTDKKAISTLAASLARGSNHPLSQAVARISADSVSLRDWREIVGGGVEARLADGSTARLGSLAWLRKCGVDTTAADARNEANAIGAIVGLAVGTQLQALIVLQDALKPGAAEVIAEFRRQGLKVRMITGDNEGAALAIGQSLGLSREEISAGVRPEQKAELVRQLQEKGERVAFVGDGINDAPALEQSDLGVAVSRASDIAGEAADIVLLQSDIQAIPQAIELSRATLRTIKQNLFWAFFYNAAAVPLAALGYMSPILCAAAMGVSDLVVIGNALRLNANQRHFTPAIKS